MKFDWNMFLYDLIDNMTALVQIMAWRRTGYQHYLNQCWYVLLTQIFVTWPQWVKTKCLIYASVTGSLFVQISACHLFDTKQAELQWNMDVIQRSKMLVSKIGHWWRNGVTNLSWEEGQCSMTSMHSFVLINLISLTYSKLVWKWAFCLNTNHISRMGHYRLYSALEWPGQNINQSLKLTKKYSIAGPHRWAMGCLLW